MHTERELKFSTTEEHVPSLAELRQALGEADLELSPAVIVRQVDSYFDDDAGRLQAAGWALRRRQRQRATFVTLKGAAESSGALHVRRELEVELPAAASAGPNLRWPDEIVTALPGDVDITRLKVQLELHVRRVAIQASRAGRRLAELAFDEVVCTPPGQAESGVPLRETPHFTFYEVEIEAADNTEAAADTDEASDTAEAVEAVDPAVLDDLARAVGELLPLTPSVTSKLERARVLLGPFLDADDDH